MGEPSNPPARPWARLGALLLIALLAATPFLDRLALREYEGLFQRALVTFALARTLNGVISAVQGTEVALQPAGVGVTLTPGEILDPVNDLVERFSWIMLGATVSLGLQDVLLDVSGWWPLRMCVGLLSLLLGWRLWRRSAAGPDHASGSGGAWIWRVFWGVLFLRFAVPLALIANEAVYDLFLAERYAESSAAISEANQTLETLREETVGDRPNEPAAEAAGAPPAGAAEEPAKPEGLLDALFGSVERFGRQTAASLDWEARLERFQAGAEELLEHLIQLSVVFILQTGVLPLLFLWALLQGARALFRN
jgi:hypothetical protein